MGRFYCTTQDAMRDETYCLNDCKYTLKENCMTICAYQQGRVDAIDEFSEWLRGRFASMHLFPDQRAELYVDVLKKAMQIKEVTEWQK